MQDKSTRGETCPHGPLTTLLQGAREGGCPPASRAELCPPAMLALLFVFPHQPRSSTPSFTRNGGVAWLSEDLIILCQVVGTPEAVFDSLAKPIMPGFRVHSNGKLTEQAVSALIYFHPWRFLVAKAITDAGGRPGHGRV